MSLDLGNPVHVESLRWACTYSGDIATAWPLLSAEAKEAIIALRDPNYVADLIRRLLETKGIAIEWHSYGARCIRLAWQSCTKEIDVPTNHVPRLILALLDATDRDTALAALRGTT